MSGLHVFPAPPLSELYTVQGRCGQDDLGPGHVVDGVVLVTKVAHGCHLTQLGHLLVVVGGGQVLMSGFEVLILATEDHTGCVGPQAPHGLRHMGPPQGWHAANLGHGGYFPTGH